MTLVAAQSMGPMLSPVTMQCSTTRRGTKRFHVRPSVTGRDTTSWSRLTFTVEALSGPPIELRPDNNIADMKRLVEEFVKHDAGLAHSQLIARRRVGHVLAYGKTNGA
jgi:hypothetical protein